MAYQKFEVRKLERLNDTGRFETLIPSAMWDALDCPTPSVIVEIGSGPGLFAAKFAEMVPDATVYAVDTEQAMIDWMRVHRPEVRSGNIVPVLAAETQIPLPSGIADLVTMINLHHELAEPDRTYAEAFRIAATEGQILVVDWAPIETPRGPSLAVRVSADILAEYLRNAGFVDVRTHVGLPWHSMLTGKKAIRRGPTPTPDADWSA